MSDKRLDLKWPVSTNGYDWRQAEDGYWQLRDWGYHAGHRYYEPLKVSGLFRTFAATPLQRDEVQAFANEYGLLQGFAHREPYDEGLDSWMREIWMLRQTVTLWDAATVRDEKKLRGYIKWEGTTAVWFRAPSKSIAKAISEMADLYERPISQKGVETYWDDPSQRLTPRDVIKPAQFFVEQTVNDYLKRLAPPALHWDPQYAAMSLCLAPQTLLGCLWLQFADGINKNTLYRECAECGTSFAVGPGVGRIVKLFCSSACRSKNYRDRRRQAQSLHAEGQSVKDIAKQLDTDVATARRWIARRRGR